MVAGHRVGNRAEYIHAAQLFLSSCGIRGRWCGRGAQQIIDDELALVLREKIKRRHHALARLEQREHVWFLQALLDAQERRHVLRLVAHAVESVAGSADLREDGFARRQRFAAFGFSFHHRHHPRHLVAVHIQHAVGISRRTAPFRAAIEAWKEDRAFATGRKKRRVRTNLREAFKHLPMGFGREVCDVIVSEELARERRGFGRNRLRGPGGFALEVGHRHRHFANRKERFAGLTVEGKYMPRLRDLRDGVDPCSTLRHRQQIRRCGQIAIPQVVMDELLMPHALPRLRIERDKTVRKEVLPDAIASPEVERRRAGRAEDEAALFVEREAGPDIHAADVLIGVGRPCFVAGLAGMWNGVEAPREFAGAHVVGANVAGRSGSRAFTEAHAHDQEIAVDDARRGGLHGKPGDIATEIALEVNGSAVAKRWNALAGRGINRVEETIVAVENAALRSGAPVNEAAIDARLRDAFHRGRIETPQLTAGRGVEREELQVGRRAVEHAVDDERIALNLRAVVGIHAARAKRPRDFELRDIARRDLLQRRVMATGLVAEIGAPV